jgi:hypothetical protein
MNLLQSKVFSLASNSQPGGPGPCINVSPGDNLAQLYPQASGSSFVPFYVSQGDGGSIPVRLHTEDK